MQFEDAGKINRDFAEAAFASGDEARICRALLSLAFYDPDWQGTQEHCLEFLQSDKPNIAALSATCLGHIARIHGKLDKEKVLVALMPKLNSPEFHGTVQDAIDDITMFCRA